MEHARPPPELQIEGSPVARADAWRKWWKQFEVFLKASGVNKEPLDVQASLLVNLIGAEGYEIFSTFTFSGDESANKLTCVKAKFDEHFGTKCNVTMLRFKFFTRNQVPGETISQYVTALKLLSQNCEFAALTDGLIRDRVVCGVISNIVRDRMLRTEDLTLTKAVQICEAEELSKEESRQIEHAMSTSTISGQVDAMSSRNAGPGRRNSSGIGAHAGKRRGGEARAGVARAASRDRDYRGDSTGDSGAVTPRRQRDQCTRCGSKFCVYSQKCPAINAKCFLCNNRGHYAKKCPTKNDIKVHGLNVSQSQLREDSEDEDILYVNVVKTRDSYLQGQWIEFLNCNGLKLGFKLDCGADLNVISKIDFYRLGLNKSCLKPYKVGVFSYTKNKLPIIGECSLKINHNNNEYTLQCAVIDMNVQNILGRYDSVKLGFIKRVDTVNQGFIDEFSDLFQGVGRVPGVHKILIDDSVQPVVCPARKIPLGLRDKLQAEIGRMEKIGVVRKVNHPTDWVNPIVIAAKKNGDIRVCLDARKLNSAVKRAHYSLPTVSEIAARLRGAKYFSVLDARCGFWMLCLDDVSADLCTFSTPFGRYQFTRLPYGVSCAPEMFHAKVRQLLEDLEGTDSFSDDVIIWGSSKQEHDRRLRRLMMRSREVGIRFNKDKCKFGVREITYLGHVFDEKGMRPDKQKVRAIVDMPIPEDKKALERFLGMVNYLSKFIPNYSQSVAVLRGLLKKNSEWIWEGQHTEGVKLLKQKNSTAPVLSLYSHDLPITLSVDASAGAVGAVILQAGHPVEFASLTLTDTQCRYAQIEKELLAIVFACERFHQYIFGRTDVTIQSDHKPLEAIFRKSLSDVPARLQRMMLRIQAYDIKVIYTPGKFMYLADTLSRAALPELMHERVNEEVEAQTCFLIKNVQFSDAKLDLVREHTAKDEEAKLLIKYIDNGWPKNKYAIEDNIRRYWSYRECFQYVDGVIFKDNSVYIPQELRSEMLNRIHEGHLGIDKCKRRARSVLFWPGMTTDIEHCVRACPTCALHAPAPNRETLLPHHIPDVPWSKIGSDIFEYRRKYYLVLVDYFSNFVEVNELNSINSKSVIKAMKEQFARYGIPNQLVTDNGPAYTSKEFNKFLEVWQIKQVTSSPLYPQSNGKSERAIKTVKSLLKKCIDSGHDYYLSLLNFRSTPREKIDSPAQILMGRQLSTRLPIHKERLMEKVDIGKNHKEILNQQMKQKIKYDSSARDLPTLRENEKVVLVDGDKRKSMKVVHKSSEPRSYILQDAVGREYRRNRRHIISRYGNSDKYESAESDTEVKNEDDGYVLDEPVGLLPRSPRSQQTSGSASDQKACGSPQIRASKHTPDKRKWLTSGPVTRSKARRLTGYMAAKTAPEGDA